MPDVFLYGGEPAQNDVKLRDPTTSGGAPTFTVSLSDTLTLTDAVAKTGVLAKADTLTLTDAIAKTLILSKSDSSTMTDALAKVLARVAADTITLADAAAKTSVLAKTDTITLSDVPTVVLGAAPVVVGGGGSYGPNPLLVPTHWPTPPAYDPTREDEALVLILAALT